MSSEHTENRNLLTPIAWAGLVVGTLDIGVAMAIYRTRPVIVLQSIASGLMGKPAYRGACLLLRWGCSCSGRWR